MYTGERAVPFGVGFPTNGLTGSVDRDLYDVGVNWLINNDKLKVNLHYIWGKRADKGPNDNFAYFGLGTQMLY